MSSTSVLIWWGNISCTELNSDLLSYTVHYNSDGDGDDWNTIDVAGSTNTYNITGLTPYTNYSIQVAAMNTLGDLGPYSVTIIVQTLEDSKSVQTLVHFLIHYISSGSSHLNVSVTHTFQLSTHKFHNPITHCMFPDTMFTSCILIKVTINNFMLLYFLVVNSCPRASRISGNINRSYCSNSYLESTYTSKWNHHNLRSAV